MSYTGKPLDQHFREHLSTAIPEARTAFIHAVLGDPKAMNELDIYFEVWPDIDLRLMCPAQQELYDERLKLQKAMAVPDLVAQTDCLRKIRELRVRISCLVEDVWIDRAGKFFDNQLENVNWAQLLDAENVPEPEGVA